MTSHSMRSRALAGCALVLLLATPPARAAVSDDEIARYADQLFSQTFPADEPGAAVLVKKDGKVLLRKGYGMANLELGVPIVNEVNGLQSKPSHRIVSGLALSF